MTTDHHAGQDKPAAGHAAAVPEERAGGAPLLLPPQVPRAAALRARDLEPAQPAGGRPRQAGGRGHAAVDSEAVRAVR